MAKSFSVVGPERGGAEMAEKLTRKVDQIT
jgi:hypothetical protein